MATAFVAWWAIREQNKRAQLTLSVNLTQQFGDKWDSVDMKTTREQAAAYILRATSTRQHLTDNDKEDRDALLDVLNFFDRLGTVVQSGAIDEHFVWNEFFPTVQMYWRGAEPLVKDWRTEQNRRLYLEDVEYLSKTLADYEKKQLTARNLPNTACPSQEKVRDYLRNETDLLS